MFKIVEEISDYERFWFDDMVKIDIPEQVIERNKILEWLDNISYDVFVVPIEISEKRPPSEFVSFKKEKEKWLKEKELFEKTKRPLFIPFYNKKERDNHDEKGSMFFWSKPTEPETHIYIRGWRFFFRNKDDAALFKLTWA